MIFKIEWQAIVGTYLLNVSSTELVEAQNSTQALNMLRTTIITKLASLNSSFYINSIRFINIGHPITVSIEEQFQFLNSLNEEGGLIQNVPKETPTKVNYQKDPSGNLFIEPTYPKQQTN